MRKIQGYGYNVGTRLSSYHGTVNAPAVSTLRLRQSPDHQRTNTFSPQIRFFHIVSQTHHLYTDSVTNKVGARQSSTHLPAVWSHDGHGMGTSFTASLRSALLIVCVLTVYISNLIAQTPFPTAMIWGGAPYIGLIVSLATQFGPPGVHAS